MDNFLFKRWTKTPTRCKNFSAADWRPPLLDASQLLLRGYGLETTDHQSLITYSFSAARSVAALALGEILAPGYLSESALLSELM